MNAAVHAFEDLNFAVDDDSPPASQQRQLANELARVRTQACVRRARVARDRQRARRHLLRSASAIISSSMPARRWRSSRRRAATSCSGAPKRLRSVRPSSCAPRVRRIAELGEWFSHMEGRQAALREQVRQFNDSIDAIERALFEVQYEEEQLSYEWEIEREIDEKPRIAILPWSYQVEDQKRFRKSAAITLLFTVLFSVFVTQVTLPPLIADNGERDPAACRAPADGRAADAAAGAGRDAEAEGEGGAEAGREAGTAREGRAESRGARAEGTGCEGSGHPGVPREARFGEGRAGRRQARLAGEHRQLGLQRRRAHSARC